MKTKRAKTFTMQGYDGLYKLVFEGNGSMAHKGDQLIDFRGDRMTLVDGQPPHKPGASGRIYVTERGWDGTRTYYAGVGGLEWEKI